MPAVSLDQIPHFKLFELPTQAVLDHFRPGHARGTWDDELWHMQHVDECACCGEVGHYFQMISEQVARDGKVFVPVTFIGTTVENGNHRVLSASLAGIERVPAFVAPSRNPEAVPSDWPDALRKRLGEFLERGQSLADFLGRSTRDETPGFEAAAYRDELEPATEYERRARYLPKHVLLAERWRLGRLYRDFPVIPGAGLDDALPSGAEAELAHFAAALEDRRGRAMRRAATLKAGQVVGGQ